MLFLVFTFNATTLSAGDKLRLNIPAGQATESLKALVEQTGLQLIYRSDALSDLKTKAVRGKYSPRQALDRMLASAPVQVVQDSDSGAFAIIPNKTKDKSLSNQSSPPLEPTEKKNNTHFEQGTPQQGTHQTIRNDI